MAAAPSADGGEQLLPTTIPSSSSSCQEEEARSNNGGESTGPQHIKTGGAVPVPHPPSWFTAVAHRVWSAGPLLMLMSAFCFSLMDVCAKAAERRLPALQAVAARVAFMLPFNTLVLWHNGIDFRGHADTRGLLLQRGVCGFFAFSCLLQAVQWLPVGDAVVIFYTYPAGLSRHSPGGVTRLVTRSILAVIN
jgi:hypothetical protein